MTSSRSPATIYFLVLARYRLRSFFQGLGERIHSGSNDTSRNFLPTPTKWTTAEFETQILNDQTSSGATRLLVFQTRVF